MLSLTTHVTSHSSYTVHVTDTPGSLVALPTVSLSLYVLSVSALTAYTHTVMIHMVAQCRDYIQTSTPPHKIGSVTSYVIYAVCHARTTYISHRYSITQPCVYLSLISIACITHSTLTQYAHVNICLSAMAKNVYIHTTQVCIIYSKR